MKRRDFHAAAAGAFSTLAAPGLAPAAPRGMKPLRIVKVQTVEVRDVPTGKGLVLPWDPKKIPQDTRDYVITQLFTDQGITGITMDGDYKLTQGAAAEVQKYAEAYFTGKDPFALELHNREFFHKIKGRMRLFYLEIGLWDIIGKVLGAPLWKLWGGNADKVQPYAATVHFNKTAEERAEDARRFYELGFRAIKLRVHNTDYRDDLKLCEAVAKAVGGNMDVMVDANQAGKRPTDPPPVWDLNHALFMARELENLGLYWLEEPLGRFAYDDLARVRAQRTRMHLAGGEGNIGLADFRNMLQKKAYSYLQPDPVQSGTMTDLRKIAALAEAFDVPIGPHHGKSGVGMLASLHLQCAIPNTGYLEYMYDPGFWNPEGFQAGFREPYPVGKDGYVRAPQSPGLGADWDPSFLRKHGLTAV